jgi:hypothetical protein
MPKPSPKKRLKKGSLKNGDTLRWRTTRLEKMLTTAGATFLTTGAKDSSMPARVSGTALPWARTAPGAASASANAKQAVRMRYPTVEGSSSVRLGGLAAPFLI